MSNIGGRISIIIGNILDHYDTALFWLLAPVIGKLFFPAYEPLTQIILTYAAMSITWVTRPLGSIYFGNLASKKGGKYTLCFSLSGVGIITGFMGFIPDYNNIGILAPILISVLRGLQGFFASSEAIIGSMFLIDITCDNKTQWSGLFQASSIIGVVIASNLIFILSNQDLLESYWRYLFLFGFVTSLIGLYLRISRLKERHISLPSSPGRKTGAKDRIIVIIGILATGILSYTTYYIPFVLMNSLIPNITDLSYNLMIEWNSILLAFDCAALFMLSLWIKNKYVAPMLFGSLGIILIACPLLSFITSESSLNSIVITRFAIVFFGVIFCFPLSHFVHSISPPPNGYLIYSTSYGIGIELFGRSTPLIGTMLYYYSGNTFLLSCYLAFWAILSVILIILLYKKTAKISGKSLYQIVNILVTK